MSGVFAVTYDNTNMASTMGSAPSVFYLEQTIAAIRKEIAGAPPFAKANDVRRAEIDQLTDMIDRRR